MNVVRMIMTEWKWQWDENRKLGQEARYLCYVTVQYTHKYFFTVEMAARKKTFEKRKAIKTIRTLAKQQNHFMKFDSSNGGVVESFNGGVVESSNGGAFAASSHRRIVKWWSCRMLEISNRRMVELSNRRMVEWWSCWIVAWWSYQVDEYSNGGVVESSNGEVSVESSNGGDVD